MPRYCVEEGDATFGKTWDCIVDKAKPNAPNFWKWVKGRLAKARARIKEARKPLANRLTIASVLPFDRTAHGWNLLLRSMPGFDYLLHGFE